MAVCLVTGGAGFIGSHLVERLVDQGHQVHVLDDFSTGIEQNLALVRNRIEVIPASILDTGTVRWAVQSVDWLFHLAALPSVKRSIEDSIATHSVCATGTLILLEAARMAGVRRVVYAASSSAYGDVDKTVRRESDPLSPLSPYAVAKLAGEHYCASFTKVHGLETVRLRFFNVFGPRQRADSAYSGVIPRFLQTMIAGKAPTINGDGLQSRDFTYVSNVVDALVAAASAPEAVGQVYNVGNGGSTRILDLVSHINDLLGARIEPIFGPLRPGDIRRSVADITLARKDLGYTPSVSFEDGLQRTLEALHVQLPLEASNTEPLNICAHVRGVASMISASAH